jgi:nucleolar protein 15
MREYFGQFGKVTRLRLSRNKATGASKHYAFIEFANRDVADVAARTMDNYLLFGRVLKCKLLAPEQVHARLWIGANRRFKKIPWADLRKRKLEQPKTEEAWEEQAGRERKRRNKRAAKLQEQMGYVYEAPELKAAIAEVVQAAAVEGDEMDVEGGEGKEADEAKEEEPKLLEAPAPADEVTLQATDTVAEKGEKVKKAATRGKAGKKAAVQEEEEVAASPATRARRSRKA